MKFIIFIILNTCIRTMNFKYPKDFVWIIYMNEPYIMGFVFVFSPLFSIEVLDVKAPLSADWLWGASGPCDPFFLFFSQSTWFYLSFMIKIISLVCKTEKTTIFTATAILLCEPFNFYKPEINIHSFVLYKNPGSHCTSCFRVIKQDVEC